MAPTRTIHSGFLLINARQSLARHTSERHGSAPGFNPESPGFGVPHRISRGSSLLLAAALFTLAAVLGLPLAGRVTSTFVLRPPVLLAPVGLTLRRIALRAVILFWRSGCRLRLLLPLRLLRLARRLART
jgi:hypothetical protein